MRGASTVLLLLAIPLFPTALAAQAPPTVTRTYLPNLADEDWSFLKNRATRTDFWDPLKYIELGRENWYLTLSGEIRFRPEGFRLIGEKGPAQFKDTYLLQRYLFGADMHLGRRFRFFGEVQSGIINGKFNSPRPTDEDTVDLHQAFFEWKETPREKETFRLRIGRQELAVGSSRVISASPSLNVKRSFDGAIVSYLTDSWRAHGFGAKLVRLSPGAFDDPPDPEQVFWGVAVARQSPRFKQGELGLYYLGLDRRQSFYAQGIGPEIRHTVGLKWAGTGTRFDLNYDAIFQWGNFAGNSVVGWAFSTETGYRFPKARFRPRISIRADTASGDKDAADPSLQSFNPMFPGSSYAGLIGLLGPTNITDITPAVSFVFHPRVFAVVECPNYWRTSLADGLYATDLRLLARPAADEGRYVASNPGLVVAWQVARHLTISGAITRVLFGPILEHRFAADALGFYSMSVTYRF